MIDGRLKSIADMINITGDGGENTVVADVGSDHAYLPVWLYLNKRIKKAFATDISINSVEKIKRNISRYNISHEIIVPVLSDGLSAFDNNFYDAGEITHIVIAGMGGNNIAQIIGSSTIAKQKILILQPNTNIEFLREFLYNNKFNITDENLIVDNRRFYVAICAKYNINSSADDIDMIDIIIGKRIREKKPEGYKEYVGKQIKRLKNILIDLEEKHIAEREYIQTDYGNYYDIENLIIKLKNL